MANAPTQELEFLCQAGLEKQDEEEWAREPEARKKRHTEQQVTWHIARRLEQEVEVSEDDDDNDGNEEEELGEGD